MFAQGFVGDRGRQLAQAPLEAGALFRRVERLALGLAQEQHFRERLRAGDDLADRLGPARAGEIVGVLTLGQQREAKALARPDQRQRELDRAKRGLAARCVAVEAKDRLGRERPQPRALIRRQRGAERRHRLRKSRLRHRDDVDIALDDDDLASVERRLSRAMMVEEQRSLVKELGLRRIQVFRPARRDRARARRTR